jgi:pyrroline-5-carboxylate reductase
MKTSALEHKSLGFIGAGRITRIILQAFRNRNLSFRQILVIDTNQDVLEKLGIDFPVINTTSDDLHAVADNDIVFIALHPPVIIETLGKISPFLDGSTVLVSLAPKITIEKIGRSLNDHNKIARVIPNAPSIINEGYNPVCFSGSLTAGERKLLTEMFEKLGKCVVVPEDKLEAYAIVTAMSPTYFWFQFQELYDIGLKLGLSPEECREGIADTIKASLGTLFNSDLKKEEVFDLIPLKPISEFEADIVRIYQSKLVPLFDKIKP